MCLMDTKQQERDPEHVDLLQASVSASRDSTTISKQRGQPGEKNERGDRFQYKIA